MIPYDILHEISTNPKVTVSQCKILANLGMEYLENQRVEVDDFFKKVEENDKESARKFIKGRMEYMEKCAGDIIEFAIEADRSLKKEIEFHCMHVGFEDMPDMPVLTDQQCRDLSEKYNIDYHEIRSEFSNEPISLPNWLTTH